MNSSVIFQIRSLLQNAQSVLIALGQDANDDAIAAGLSLYLILAKMRKQPTIVSPADVKVGQAYLFGIDKISKQLSGGNTLVISLPYKEGTIEKVSYNIENDKFNLVIEPRGELLTFRPEEVEYNFGKGEYDLVFVLGTPQLDALGNVYKNHRNAFSQKQIITIDNKQDTSKFGQINIVEQGPISQTVALLIRTLRLPLDEDPASNLYTGIISSGAPLSLDTASADTLEVVAFLLRSKARNLKKEGSNQQKQMSSPPKNQAMDNQQVRPSDEQDQNEAPEDWLKPKIFTTHNN